jgi:hypothetical protein
LKPDYEDDLNNILSKLKKKKQTPRELLTYFLEREGEDAESMLKILEACKS